LAGLIAASAVSAIVVGLARLGTLRERQAARWLGLGLLWTSLALMVISPSLATVIPGLPNDHYHAFADPMVFTLVGLGAGALWRVRPGANRRERPDDAAGGERTGDERAAGPERAGDEPAGERTIPIGPAVVIAAVAVLIAWNLVNQPPAVHPDGGFPAAEAAGARILAATGPGAPITLRSLPDFKSTEAYAYPLVRAGASVVADTGSGPATTVGPLVVICDSLFEEAIGAPCAGQAEATVAPPERFGEPIDRFEAAPGRTISVYRGAR
jgi:hypothetical protein